LVTDLGNAPSSISLWGWWDGYTSHPWLNCFIYYNITHLSIF